ncbi:recombination regulator RecX [Legionella sp. CNM-4043-24]|uniref:recombination regulator RecX n=1 Tax=Legionella sp. CNM-4043-24 TaxID=3421646 RepID=UPI00403AAF4E
MTKALDCALRLLVRREHGMRELSGKLLRKGFDKADCDEAVRECQRLGYQSDERFVDMFCSARIRQGYGPVRIRQELQARQIDQDLIDAALAQQDGQWEEHALAVWQKKYRHCVGSDYIERQKQQQFLMYRGFYAETITRLLASIKTRIEPEFRG